MNRHVLISAVAVVAIGVATVSRAQTPNPLVGAWERVSLLDADGKAIQPPLPPAFVIFSADGFFSQTAVSTGRSKVDKALDQLTKEELFQRFNRLEARRGTYTIAGNRLTRRNIVHSNPNQEGSESVQLFRIEGGMLILSSADPKLKNEARFRRAK
jgi:hypothetical protein